MIFFPNAKINLGLRIPEKRWDGFHNIESVFYPVKASDILEIIKNPNQKREEDKIDFSFSGIKISGSPDDNLISKAYHLLDATYTLPAVKIHLHKVLPMGSGLGGGSSDAAFTLKCLNALFNLGLDTTQLLAFAAKLGSDCAFFTRNEPVMARERGDAMEGVKIDLSKYKILIVWPGIHSSTAEAYAGIVPDKSGPGVLETISGPVEDWKDRLRNDFEKSIFLKYPEIKNVKESLYSAGAVYASMSGSGSAVYGIFRTEIPALKWPDNYWTHLE
jgi:4-diphosphocytidyl-2-C-methyl-D-erythritol kinase